MGGSVADTIAEQCSSNLFPRRFIMAAIKTIIAEKVQNHLEKLDWHAAIRELEKLFAINRDPLIRVRIGDIRRKLNKRHSAVREYIRAADLFAEKGFILKALAQYNLALRLEPSNAYVRSRVAVLSKFKAYSNMKREAIEYKIPQSLETMPDIYINIGCF